MAEAIDLKQEIFQLQEDWTRMTMEALLREKEIHELLDTIEAITDDLQRLRSERDHYRAIAFPKTL